MTHETPTKVAIVTALPVEHAAVLRHLVDAHQERHPTGTEYQVGRFGTLTVSIAQIGAGNATSALETERMMSYFKPDLALFVGIAGGVKDVVLGDVVAATKVYGYENGADRDTFEPRPEVGLASYPLIQQANAVVRESKWLGRIQHLGSKMPQAFVGAIAAGSKVVKSSRGAVANLLRQNYGDTLAVEMEGEGFMRAAYTNRVDAMVVRGISDVLDGKREADLSGSQEVASDHAAAFGFELLARLSGQKVVDVAREAYAIERWEAVEDRSEFWLRLRELAPRLYPRGPDENSVWEDAGGDLSYLNLLEIGRTQWARAVRLLEKGGGGDISATRLLDRMLQEYPKNYELQYLRARLIA